MNFSFGIILMMKTLFYSRGQILPITALKSSVQVEFIYEGFKYVVSISKMGPSSYFIVMNDSHIDVEAHHLSDGGLLVSLGNSYTTYLKESVSNYRVTIDNKTCVLEKENDPTVLRSPCSGKLINFTVEDGGHVCANEVYAEIEVMKMVMELRASESGCVHFQKRAGAVLEAGSIIAQLELDDPSKVQKAEIFTGKLPANLANPSLNGNKLHQQYQQAKCTLESVLNGYTLPDPYFIQRLNETIDLMMHCLSDARLPLLELQDLISAISGRIPSDVEKRICKLMAIYSKNRTSVMSQFPSQQILTVIESHAATLTKKRDQDEFLMAMSSVVQLVQQYRCGTKGHMKNVVQDLLKKYLNVELQFQQGHYDKCLAVMREKVKDVGEITDIIFSHSQVEKKNMLVISLIVSTFPILYAVF